MRDAGRRRPCIDKPALVYKQGGCQETNQNCSTVRIKLCPIKVVCFQISSETNKFLASERTFTSSDRLQGSNFRIID